MLPNRYGIADILTISFSITLSMGSMHLSNNIKRFRKVSGLTLHELADKAECTKTYIWQLENGTVQNPSLKILTKIAVALDVTIDQLVDPPAKRKNTKLEAFYRDFRKLDEENQRGIIAQVNELLRIKKSAG